jgi:ABC-type branched-subunit amino acid transport system substrate-binding protein
MRKRRLVRAAAVFSGLALVLAACGDDDDEASDATTTTAAADESTTTTEGGSSGGGGELVGAKGTTPAPELTDSVQAFQTRMEEHASAAGIDLDGTFAYGPESYDSTIIIALASIAAGTDGSAHAGEIVNVTKGGTKCSSFEECAGLLAGGTADIDYEGVSGPTDMSGNGEPLIGSYALQVYGEDNRLDPEQETFLTVNASQEFVDMPNDPIEVERAGDGVLTIGTLLPETGNLAFLGPPEIAGVQMAVAEINAAGGVNGQQVVLVEGDSGDTTTDTAVQTVTRELGQNVDAIIGAASSSVSASVIDQVTSAGVTQISPANTSKQFSDYPDKGLYFRLGPSDILQGQVLAEVIAEEGNSSLVILNFDDDYGNGLAEDLAASFTAGGGEVVDTITYDPQAQTFDAEVQQAIDADADAIALIGFEETSRLLVTLVEQGLGPNDIPTYMVDGNIGNPLGERFDAGE